MDPEERDIYCCNCQTTWRDRHVCPDTGMTWRVLSWTSTSTGWPKRWEPQIISYRGELHLD